MKSSNYATPRQSSLAPSEDIAEKAEWVIDPTDLAVGYQQSAARRAARITSLLKEVEKLEARVEELSEFREMAAGQQSSVSEAVNVPAPPVGAGKNSGPADWTGDAEILLKKTSWQKAKIAQLAGKNDALQSKVEWQRARLARQSAAVDALTGKVEWQKKNLIKQREKNAALQNAVTSQKATIAKQKTVLASQSVRIYDLERRHSILEDEFQGYLKFKSRPSVRLLRRLKSRFRSWSRKS